MAIAEGSGGTGQCVVGVSNGYWGESKLSGNPAKERIPPLSPLWFIACQRLVRRQCRKSNRSSRYPRLFFVRGLPQHVAAAPHGFDVVLAARGVGEFLAQLAYKDVNYF